MGIKIEKRICTENPCYKAGRKIKPKGGMLHSVGCPQPNPEVFVNIWSKSDANVCVHAVVGVDKIIYQCLPWDHRGWHAGGSGNNFLIGIEMTEPATIKYVGGSNWIELGNGANTKSHVLATYQNAVEFYAFICKEYGFNPEDSDVLMSHREGCSKGVASNHGDVEHLWNQFGLSMNQFRKDVKKAMQGDTVIVGPVSPESDDTSGQNVNALKGTVKVIYDGKDGLNIRKAPSYIAQIEKVADEGDTFTVVGISADEKWYKLEDGLFISAIPQYVEFHKSAEQESTSTGYFRVRKSWNDVDSQIAAFKIEENAINLCKQNSGYKVFDDNGEEIYPCVKEEEAEFLFRVTIPDLRIRKGPGTTYDYHKDNGNARYTKEGTFTIVKTKEGPGADLWGLLKSYADDEDGWIALDNEYGYTV